MLAAFVSLLVAVAPAAGAAPSCGRQVIDDWYDDGRIDGTYALHCYDDAIESLPRDVRDYSSARRTSSARSRRSCAASRPRPRRPIRPRRTAPGRDAAAAAADATAAGDDPPPTDEPPATRRAPPVGESASSVPVPLLVLAGLALLLVAGGSAGYLVRRFQSRQIPPPAV